ncbi:MAG: hypothetical protein KGZ75_13760 [Syntrophomonadaceae bacterium]|nr:hypothetical protein [Syntrophomonadaceae bacterium]
MDPYDLGLFRDNPYKEKMDIRGRLVVVLQGALDDRQLKLIKTISRAVKRYEVHEIILTDEEQSGPGATVNRVIYIGFMEVTRSGVIVSGDEFFLGDRLLGTVAGFDETHLPNHLNIVIQAGSGIYAPAVLGEKIVIRQKKEEN